MKLKGECLYCGHKWIVDCFQYNADYLANNMVCPKCPWHTEVDVKKHEPIDTYRLPVIYKEK